MENGILLLEAAFWSYGFGMLSGIMCAGRNRAANVLSFGAASLAGLLGLAGAVCFLLGAPAQPVTLELWPTVIPFAQFTIRVDPLGAFFVLIVSCLGLALSVYSFGYVRRFYGRKSVGVLAAFYNALLLATTLVFHRRQCLLLPDRLGDHGADGLLPGQLRA